MRQSYVTLGKKIYDIRKSREARRMLVFVARCYFNRRRLEALDEYFHRTPLLAEIADLYPFVYEQPTRAFFYHRSTFDERARLVEEHMEFLAARLRPEVFKAIYREEEQGLWQMERDGGSLDLSLFYEPGQRKEGLLSVVLRLGTAPLYQMIFWIARDHAQDGAWALWIGAMQGPNGRDAKEIIRTITKECHAYRTKNLILYATQAVARSLGIERIYAVTNEGYYANNHMRMDRKLKTSFSDFWMEAGGWKTEDARFDGLPLTEPRKTMAEVPTRKRAVYRKRFAFLDEIDAAVAASMMTMMREDR